MDVVSKDLISQINPQWLRSLISEHVLIFPARPPPPPKKKNSQSSLEHMWVSTETRWRLGNQIFTWLISSHSFPLVLTCLRNLVRIHGQNLWDRFSFVWFNVFIISSSKSPQCIFANDHKDELPVVSKGEVPCRYRMPVVTILVYSITPFAIHRGVGGFLLTGESCVMTVPATAELKRKPPGSDVILK